MSILSIRQMAAVIRSVLAAARQYKPNLAVNDPDDPRYVSGRLCYETDPQVMYLAKDKTFELEDVDDVSLVSNAFDFDLEAGKTYTVTWDGVRYNCVCFENFHVQYIGNANILDSGMTNTSEPFFIFFEGGMNLALHGGGSHTVSVSTMGQSKIIPLPDEYLPSIPASKLPVIPTEKLPAITAEMLPEIPESRLAPIPAAKITGLAAVATSGIYNDLIGIPCKMEVISKSNIDGMESYPAIINSAWDGPRYGVGSSKSLLAEEEDYIVDSFSWMGKAKKYGPVKFTNSSGYSSSNGIIVLGNASMISADLLKAIFKWQTVELPEMPDTGEHFVIGFWSSSGTSSFCVSTPYRLVDKSDIYHVDNMRVSRLDERYIPSTIQRTGGPVILADSSGAKWRLTVGTDGTLTTEAVTE